MKTIIAGSRDCTDYNILLSAISNISWKPSTIISGTARGVDRLGKRWAIENNIPLIRMPAQWDKYGKRAGYLRNESMAKISEALIAIWDGISPGTKHMIDVAKNFKLLIYISYSK
jgi:hypothetical protein